LAEPEIPGSIPGTVREKTGIEPATYEMFFRPRFLSLFARSPKTRPRRGIRSERLKNRGLKKSFLAEPEIPGSIPGKTPFRPVGRKTPPIAFFETENAASSLGHVAVRFRKLETAAPGGENARFAREEDKLSF